MSQSPRPNPKPCSNELGPAMAQALEQSSQVADNFAIDVRELLQQDKNISSTGAPKEPVKLEHLLADSVDLLLELACHARGFLSEEGENDKIDPAQLVAWIANNKGARAREEGKRNYADTLHDLRETGNQCAMAVVSLPDSSHAADPNTLVELIAAMDAAEQRHEQAIADGAQPYSWPGPSAAERLRVLKSETAAIRASARAANGHAARGSGDLAKAAHCYALSAEAAEDGIEKMIRARTSAEEATREQLFSTAVFARICQGCALTEAGAPLDALAAFSAARPLLSGVGLAARRLGAGLAAACCSLAAELRRCGLAPTAQEALEVGFAAASHGGSIEGPAVQARLLRQAALVLVSGDEREPDAAAERAREALRLEPSQSAGRALSLQVLLEVLLRHPRTAKAQQELQEVAVEYVLHPNVQLDYRMALCHRIARTGSSCSTVAALTEAFCSSLTYEQGACRLAAAHVLVDSILAVVGSRDAAGEKEENILVKLVDSLSTAQEAVAAKHPMNSQGINRASGKSQLEEFASKLYLLAKAEFRCGRFMTSAKWFRLCMPHLKCQSTARRALAVALWRGDEPQMAIEQLDYITEMGDPMVDVLRIVCFVRLGSLEEVRDGLGQVLLHRGSLMRRAVDLTSEVSKLSPSEAVLECLVAAMGWLLAESPEENHEHLNGLKLAAVQQHTAHKLLDCLGSLVKNAQEAKLLDKLVWRLPECLDLVLCTLAAQAATWPDSSINAPTMRLARQAFGLAWQSAVTLFQNAGQWASCTEILQRAYQVLAYNGGEGNLVAEGKARCALLQAHARLLETQDSTEKSCKAREAVAKVCSLGATEASEAFVEIGKLAPSSSTDTLLAALGKAELELRQRAVAYATEGSTVAECLRAYLGALAARQPAPQGTHGVDFWSRTRTNSTSDTRCGAEKAGAALRALTELGGLGTSGLTAHREALEWATSMRGAAALHAGNCKAELRAIGASAWNRGVRLKRRQPSEAAQWLQMGTEFLALGKVQVIPANAI